MANEQEYPAGYYFDDKKDDVIAVPAEVTANEVHTEVVAEAPMETKTETVKAPEISPSEVAKQRREGVVKFFKDTKTNFKNKMQSIGGGIKKFFGKAKTLGNEVIDVVVAPDAYIKKGAENLATWSKNKVESISNFAKSKAELIAAIASLVENKTIDKINEIQSGISQRYEALKQHGTDAIESGAGKIRDVKEGLRDAKNSLIIAFLKSIEERHRAKADKVASTIQLLQGLKTN